MRMEETSYFSFSYVSWFLTWAEGFHLR